MTYLHTHAYKYAHAHTYTLNEHLAIAGVETLHNTSLRRRCQVISDQMMPKMTTAGGPLLPRPSYPSFKVRHGQVGSLGPRLHPEWLDNPNFMHPQWSVPAKGTSQYKKQKLVGGWATPLKNISQLG